jgi:hypothetical protein
MGFGSLEIQIFVSLAVILGTALIALIVDYLKGNNENLREHNIELRVREQERVRMPAPSAARRRIRVVEAREQSKIAKAGVISNVETVAPAAVAAGAVAVAPAVMETVAAHAETEMGDILSQVIAVTPPAQKRAEPLAQPDVQAVFAAEPERAPQAVIPEALPIVAVESDHVEPAATPAVEESESAGEPVLEVAEAQEAELSPVLAAAVIEATSVEPELKCVEENESEIRSVPMDAAIEAPLAEPVLEVVEEHEREISPAQTVAEIKVPVVETVELPTPAAASSNIIFITPVGEPVEAPARFRSLDFDAFTEDLEAAVVEPEITPVAIEPAAAVETEPETVQTQEAEQDLWPAPLPAVFEASAPALPDSIADTLPANHWSRQSFDLPLTDEWPAQVLEDEEPNLDTIIPAPESIAKPAAAEPAAPVVEAQPKDSERSFAWPMPAANVIEPAAAELPVWEAPAAKAWPEQAEAPELKPQLVAATEPSIRKLEIPVGMQTSEVLGGLLATPGVLSGVVVAVGINDYKQLQSTHSKTAFEDLMRSVENLVGSMTGNKGFATRRNDDEYLLIFPHDSGPAAQRLLTQISERLWDFQLRSLGSFSILFSWGAVEVVSEQLSEAIAAANEQMYQTKRTRMGALDAQGSRRRAVNH